ncbi:MAG: hypothetical protein KatS3mg031_1835 [Chitinophagales bacterium]|nr:MAG: hypothetical protein KatS3mg031_1835 [Chitinophagales bacterium]
MRLRVLLAVCLLIQGFHLYALGSGYLAVANCEHTKAWPVDSITKNAIVHDSLPLPGDSSIHLLQTTQPVPISRDTLDAEIIYSARDSIIYDVDGEKVHLFGEAVAVYKDIRLTADYIVYDWLSSTLTAEVYKDSSGTPIGYVEFSEGDSKYKAKKIAYNFKTTKGKVYQVITQEGEGFIHGEQVKRNEYKEWYGYQGKYTTCNLEHPHFYIKAKKMKVVPDKVIATGPANLVVADVPLPVFIPFGLFPIKRGQRSGILLPEYGEEQTRGFFLRNGGYYFGFSQYVDAAIRADIYSNGSFGIKLGSSYKLRYRFSGNLSVNYGRNLSGERENPSSFRVINDFRVSWNHTQDNRSARNSRFNANVNFGTTTYDRNTAEDRDRILNSNLSSKISYSKAWAGKPVSLSLVLGHDQNLNTGIINLQLPVFNLSVARIQPFQRKQRAGLRPRWYESIGFSYNFEAQNIISAVDSMFLSRQTFANARYGIRHTVPLSASFKVFKYFTLTPRFNYTERWYFQTIHKHWDPSVTYIPIGTDSLGNVIYDSINGRLVTDTLTGFKGARDFNAGVSLTTKLYGQLNFRGKLKAIRHVFTPSITFNYTPDFGKSFWGYYKTVQTSAEGATATYSVFDIVERVYGKPPRGTIGSIGFNLNNILEMKIFSRKDTVKNERKIKLLESFNISGSYNIAADSLNLSPFNISGRTSLIENKLDFNFRFTLDPYMTDQNNRRINTFVWEQEKHFFRLTNASFSLNARFQSKQTPSSSIPAPSAETSEEEIQDIFLNRWRYYDFNIPWSFNISYNINMTKGKPGNPNKLNLSGNSLDFSLDVNVTPRWKVNLRSGFDFMQMKPVITSLDVVRDLHCWVWTFHFMPYPVEYQTYSMQINVKSAILQDLKLVRKKERFDSIF